MAYPLADLGNYLNSNPFKAWKNSDGGFDEAGFTDYWQKLGNPFVKGEQGQWTINPQGRLAEFNKLYPGLDFRLENDAYTEDYEDGRPSLQLKWNASALPKDKFGNFGTSVSPLNPQYGLYNPNLKYTDPNYGLITPKQNLKGDPGFMQQVSRMLKHTPLLPTLALAGMGALAPGFSSGASLVNLGRGLANRNYSSLITAGLPFVPGMGEMASFLKNPFFRMGSSFLGNALNRRGRR
jgi:hypothetical protein